MLVAREIRIWIVGDSECRTPISDGFMVSMALAEIAPFQGTPVSKRRSPGFSANRKQNREVEIERGWRAYGLASLIG